jgi:hypothetical protein
MLANVFQFDRISNASETMREISKRAREALKMIGAESRINARRVSRFGVKFEPAEGAPVPALSQSEVDGAPTPG